MKPCEPKSQNEVDLREYFETKIQNVLTLISGNDENYKTQFTNAKEAVTAALAAQEKATSSAFLAAEKAILKAEDAQKDYNQRSNEFRGQLDDQAKTLMPRIETITLFKGIEDKLASIQIANEKVFDRITEDIKSLRESRSEGSGNSLGRNTSWEMLIQIIGLGSTLAFLFALLSGHIR